MAVQTQSEKETWVDESLASRPATPASPSRNGEKAAPSPPSSNRTRRLREASSAALRSAQHGLGSVSSASARLYRHASATVSSGPARCLYERWPRVKSRTVQIYRRVSPKVLSSASIRLYQRAWPGAAADAAGLHGAAAGTSNLGGPSPQPRYRLEATAASLRLFQLASALYVFLSVTESFRNKITYDGRVRQIQPMMLTTLIYSVLAMACFLLVGLSRRLRAAAWRPLALASLPADTAMVCLFVAKDVVFGVHSFECASSAAVHSAVKEYHASSATGKMDSLELRGFLERGGGDRGASAGYPWAALYADPTRACLLSSSVYFVCAGAALSYIASAGVTVFQLITYRKSVQSRTRGRYSGHIEEAVPDDVQFPRRMYQQGRLMPSSVMSPEGPSCNSSTTNPSPYPPAPPSPKYANMPPDLFESMAIVVRPPRISEETTTSSMDPERYIVSDGFRPMSTMTVERPSSPTPSERSEGSDRPPSYRSSRESSLGPPEYRSRPPSLHTVVMVGP